MATIELGRPVTLFDVSGILEDAEVPAYGTPAYGYDVVVTINTGDGYHVMPCDVDELEFHDRH